MSTAANGDDVVRVGIIGCGKHVVRSHLFTDIDELRFVGVYDPSTESVRAASKALGRTFLQEYPSEEAMLADANVNAVLIGTPDHLHAPSLMAAVSAGKHVFCENPLAVDEDQLRVVRAALDAARQRGLVVLSCHPRRTEPLIKQAKAVVARGRFGRPLHFEFDFSRHKPTAGSWKTRRGLFVDHANHEVDTMNALLGASDTTHVVVVDDSPARYEVFGKRADGITFRFFGTRMLETRAYREQVAIRFERGEATIRFYGASSVMNQRNHEIGPDSPETFFAEYSHDEKFCGVTRNFVRAVLGVESPYLTHDDLLRNASVVFQGVAMSD